MSEEAVSVAARDAERGELTPLAVADQLRATCREVLKNQQTPWRTAWLHAELESAARQPSRDVADVFHELLRDDQLCNRLDPEGRSTRFVLVNALLTMGFPYALEVSPEQLTAYRRHPRVHRPRQWRLSVVAAFSLCCHLRLLWLVAPEHLLLTAVFALGALHGGLVLLAALRRAERRWFTTLGYVGLLASLISVTIAVAMTLVATGSGFAALGALVEGLVVATPTMLTGYASWRQGLPRVQATRML